MKEGTYSGGILSNKMFETIFLKRISESEINIDRFPPSHLPPYLLQRY